MVFVTRLRSSQINATKKMKKFILFSFLAFLIAGCTFTTTRPRQPVFGDINKVEQELNRMVSAENINIAGKEITRNKETNAEIEVSIINGSNIPSNDEERKALGRSIGGVIKRNLQDQSQFDTYQILFVEKRGNGAVRETNYVGNIFSEKEL